MWPRPSQFAPHYCSFKRVQGTTRKADKLMSWFERCRCGRLIEVQASAGKLVKTWYDKDGGFERVTESDKPRLTAQSGIETAKPQDSEQRIFDDKAKTGPDTE